MSSIKREVGDNAQFMRMAGSMHWLKQREKKYFKAKLFKSGNSLAVRLPAGLELKAGMEMDLTVEDGMYLSLDPVEAPKRKFNIEKVAGSARSLQPIKREDRIFDERPLTWPNAEDA